MAFKLDPEGMRKMLASVELRQGITDIAERVLERAKADAPVRTGAYRDGLHVEQASGPDGEVEVRVAGGSDHDVYVEAEHGTLSRALDAAGGA